MRLLAAFITVLSLDLIRLASGFTVPHAFVSKSTKLRLTDWDNDDFLNSLSRQGGGSAEDEVEQQGTLKSPKPFQGGEDDGEPTQGGTRFRQMMQAAQSGNNRPPRVNTYAHSTVRSSKPLVPGDIENLSVEEQAAMFRQMMQQQQQEVGQESYEPPPAAPRQPRGGLDGKGRKIGRNRDADTIANASDLYFAQLKRDSAVRNMARIQGDEEYANKVFEDESVKALNDQIKVNPYLKE
jgi:hypothetical protein